VLFALAGCQRQAELPWPDRQVTPGSAADVQARLQAWLAAPTAAPLALSESDLTALLRAAADPQATAWLHQGRLYLQLTAPGNLACRAIIACDEQRPLLQLAALTVAGRPLPRPLRYLAQAALNAALTDLLLPLQLTDIAIHAGELLLTATY